MPLRSPLLATLCCCIGCDVASAVETQPLPASPSALAAGVATEIPLSHVRAYGTRYLGNVHKIPPEHRAVLDSICSKLTIVPEASTTAPPAFVVTGEVAEALAGMQRTFIDGQPPRRAFRADEHLSLVFFTYVTPEHVQLSAIEQSANSFQLQYRFLSHEESNLTQYFALIPLGQLPPGKYKLQIAPAPISPGQPASSQRHAAATAKSAICQSTTFEVSE